MMPGTVTRNTFDSDVVSLKLLAIFSRIGIYFNFHYFFLESKYTRRWVVLVAIEYFYDESEI